MFDLYLLVAQQLVEVRRDYGCSNSLQTSQTFPCSSHEQPYIKFVSYWRLWAKGHNNKTVCKVLSGPVKQIVPFFHPSLLSSLTRLNVKDVRTHSNERYIVL